MLTIRVAATDGFNETTQEFVEIGGTELVLEHSLLSLSKWEQKYEKPFLSKETKTLEEFIEYVKCMNLTPDVPPEVFQDLTQRNVDVIGEYLKGNHTATWFTEHRKEAPSQEVITAELIYYWMTAYSIPIECEAWNLNRLLTLIRVANVKNSKPKKMSKSDAVRQQRDLNAQRKAKLGTRG